MVYVEFYDHNIHVHTLVLSCTVVCSLNGDLIKCHPTVMSALYMYHTCVVLNHDNIHSCYH